MSLLRGPITRSSIAGAPRLIVPRVAHVTRLSPLLLHSRTQQRFQSTHPSTTAQLKVDKPELMIAFTCKKCSTRSSHTMSKQAYTSGTVLITCPGCKNRHLIADHLKIFSDDRITIEDILSAKGESVSSSTDDLVFDEIPEKLRGMIGHHAKDAPQHVVKETESTEGPGYLPEGAKKE